MKWFCTWLALLLVGSLLLRANGQQTTPAAVTESALEVSNSETPQKIKLGTPVNTTAPIIPKKLRKKNLVAVAYVTIGNDGNFYDVKMLGGDQQFAPLALEAMSQWRYTPATLGGKPVPAHLFVTLESKKGKLHADVEPDMLPIEPKDETSEQTAKHEVLKVDVKTMTPPKPLYTPDPEYSEEARRAKYQGVLVVGVIVGRDGNPKAVWGIKKLGLGLDEKALDIVRRWRFEPATKAGKPVAVMINVEVSFRLY